MNRNVVSLLGMIRDIAHNHDETKLGLVPVIEFDMELYLIYQSPAEPCDDYMALFKARVDTINAHGDLAGRHPGYFKEMFKYQISLSNLPNKYYGRTMMRSFYFRGGRATAVAMRQL